MQFEGALSPETSVQVNATGMVITQRRGPTLECHAVALDDREVAVLLALYQYCRAFPAAGAVEAPEC